MGISYCDTSPAWSSIELPIPGFVSRFDSSSRLFLGSNRFAVGAGLGFVDFRYGVRELVRALVRGDLSPQKRLAFLIFTHSSTPSISRVAQLVLPRHTAKSKDL